MRIKHLQNIKRYFHFTTISSIFMQPFPPASHRHSNRDLFPPWDYSLLFRTLSEGGIHALPSTLAM